MPQDFSFDVVSQYDNAELSNALDQARREVGTRFDFKGTDARIEQRGDMIVLEASTEDRARAMVQVLLEKVALPREPHPRAKRRDSHWAGLKRGGKAAPSNTIQ
jgi:uncharacterized protein YajQ (UPF0234 family)